MTVSSSDPAILATLGAATRIGLTAVGVGDLDNNGQQEIAIGVPDHDSQRGGVLIASFGAEGNLISSALLQIDLDLNPGDQFGHSISAHVSEPGSPEVSLVVGAPGKDAGLADSGGIYVVTLRSPESGSLDRIVDNTSPAMFENSGMRTTALSNIDDVDLNGTRDLGSAGWVLLLDSKGNVIKQQRNNFAIKGSRNFRVVFRPIGDLN